MQVWQAFILGIVQGLTEFLPVSSSGHLVFFQNIFSLEEPDLFYDILLHVGTLIPVCIIFFKDILALFQKPYKTLLYLVVASIPAALLGVLLDDWIEETFYGGAFLGAGFIITACVLYATEIYAKKRDKQLPLSFKTTIPMGVAQAIAMLPGISRSGSTIAAGTFAGGKREDVAKFSFLMSIPIILGSFAVSLLKGIKDGEIANTLATSSGNYVGCIVVGFIASAVAGFFAIKVMLKAIQKANYKWFSAYLVLLGVTCIVLQATGSF